MLRTTAEYRLRAVSLATYALSESENIMAIRGQHNNSSFNMSSTTPTSTSTQPLDVNINITETGIITTRTVRVNFFWTHIVDGFRDGDIRVVWYTEGGEKDEGAVGYLDTIGTDDNRSAYGAELYLPTHKGGIARVQVLANSALLSADNTIAGPPGLRTFDIRYDRRVTIETPTVNIITPPTSVFVGLEYGVRFIWSQPVSDFKLNADAMLSDVTLDLAAASITDLVQVDTEGKIWQAKVTMPPNTTGTLGITVKANSVNFQNGLAPAADYTETFQFDSRATSQRQAVIGGTLISSHTEVIASGSHIYNGVLESISSANYTYQVEQIMDIIDSSPNKFPNENKMAAAQLVRIARSDGARVIIKSWDYVTTAARSLFFKGTTLYWFEGSHYAEILNDNIDTIRVDVDMGQEDQRQYTWKNGMGKLYKLSGTMPVEVGQAHRSAFVNPDEKEAERDARYGVHIGTASPIVQLPGAGSPLSIVCGYGNLRNVTDVDNAVSNIGNWQNVIYGEYQNFRVPEFQTNRKTAWQVCEKLAKTFNAVIGFKGNRLEMYPATPMQAKLNGSLGAAATSTDIKDLNRSSIGTKDIALIGDELLGFTASGTTLGSLTRGQFNTTAAAHNPNSRVVFIDYVIDIEEDFQEQPLDAINWINADDRHFNLVKIYDNQGELLALKPDTHPSTPKLLEIHTLLDDHQTTLAEYIAEDYLLRFGTLQKQANITLKFCPVLRPYQVVFIRIPGARGIQRACQIINVRHQLDERQTHLKCITI